MMGGGFSACSKTGVMQEVLCMQFAEALMGSGLGSRYAAAAVKVIGRSRAHKASQLNESHDFRPRSAQA